MAVLRTPRLRLEGWTHLLVSYDLDDDIAVVHVDGPRPAVTVEVDDSWYLRLSDGEVVGMELHGFQRILLSDPFFAAVFKPAIDELEAKAGRSIEQGFTVEDTIEELPKSTHLVIFMLGIAMQRYEQVKREERFGLAPDVAAYFDSARSREQRERSALR